jgi:hypothetical protein
MKRDNRKITDSSLKKESLLNSRLKDIFLEKYCRLKGISPDRLTHSQIMEIVQQGGYTNPRSIKK